MAATRSTDSRPMPRAWRTASISFGLITIDVALAPLASDGKAVTSHKYNPDTNKRVKQQWIDAESDDVVAQPVTGYEVDGGIVTLDDSEKESIKNEVSKSITIEGFVSREDVDPIYFGSKYNVWPTSDASSKTFLALQKALAKQGKMAVGKVCLTDSTKMFVLRFCERTTSLVCHVCDFDANFRHKDVGLVRDALVDGEQPSEAEVDLTAQLMDLQAMDTDGFKSFAQDLTDDYQERLAEAVSTKAAGGVVQVTTPVATTQAPVDLTAALKASVAAAQAAKKPVKTKAA